MNNIKKSLINFLRVTYIKKLYDKYPRFRETLRYINKFFGLKYDMNKAFSRNSYDAYLNSPYPKRINSLKNNHSNEVCFVIGNGPSLTEEDLNKIKNIVTFGSNYLFKLNNFIPTYYFAQDFVLLKNKKFIKRVNEQSYKTKMTFLPFNILPRKVLRKFENRVISFYLNLPIENERKFSSNLTDFFEDGWTVSYSILQMAIYMGFKKIYLIGMDNTKNSHFYENISQNINLHSNQKTTKSFQHLKLIKPNDVSIINCTRGGALEVFERMNLEEALANI